MKPTKKEIIGRGGRVCIGVYVKRETHEKLHRVAKSKELGLSDIVRMAINEYLSKEE